MFLAFIKKNIALGSENLRINYGKKKKNLNSMNCNLEVRNELRLQQPQEGTGRRPLKGKRSRKKDDGTGEIISNLFGLQFQHLMGFDRSCRNRCSCAGLMLMGLT